MTVYVLLVNDRHRDPEPTVYVDHDAAMAAAVAAAAANDWPAEDLNAHMRASGWLFAAAHRTESDTLQLVERELIS